MSAAGLGHQGGHGIADGGHIAVERDGETLFDLFTRTRAIRRGVIEAGQDTAKPDFGRDHSPAPAAAPTPTPKD